MKSLFVKYFALLDKRYLQNLIAKLKCIRYSLWNFSYWTFCDSITLNQTLWFILSA